MSDIHAVPQTKPIRDGQCGWSWHWEDVVLRCDEDILPGHWFCPSHFIQIEIDGDPE